MESSDKIQSDVDSFGVSTNDKGSGGMALETNEDSSYDSDFETDETCTSHADVSRTPSAAAAHQNVSRSSSTGHSATHLDVSRTVSDTLGAEFAEYVNAETLREQQAEAASHDEAATAPKKVPGYTTRVEFALKLGYTEKLVQVALQKLGSEPSQNELLEELINLSSQSLRVAESPTTSCASDDGAAPNDAPVLHSGSHLKPIVIDGSNVAMSHGNKEVFSCRGIKICVDWFLSRGHTEITVFVPKWRKESSRPDNPISEQEILSDLEKDRLLVFTPSRLVGGKRLVCYDDRYILKLAAEVDGVVVSNDNYRDLVQESPDFRKVVEERILMFSFVNDLFMPPDDPLGRSGPTLDNFLRVDRKHRSEPPPPCPYGKKCTYGNKCKFSHPERGNMPHKSVTERLSEYAQKHIQARGNSISGCDLKTHSLPLGYDSQAGMPRKTPLGRARSAAPAPPPSDPHSQASMVSHFNRAQTEQRQAIGGSFDALSISGMTDPPKSHSIENIAGGLQDYGFGYGVGPGTGVNHSQLKYQQRGNPWGGGPPSDESSRWAFTENQEVSEAGGNMHRKLHRQLTLNPSFDPRLYRMRGVNQNAGAMAPPCPSVSAPWGGHQTVARIASAPAACPAWPPAAGQAGVSASEPHLHAPMQSSNASGAWAWAPRHDARSHLYYHLSSIFPEDQVRKAMALYPDETNPQKICAAILNMFHKT